MSTIKVNEIKDYAGTTTLAKLDTGVLSGVLSQQTGFKNRIINGDMRIDQRNAGASVTPATASYLVDRWVFNFTQASKFSFQQNAGSVTPPAGFTNYLGVTVVSAVSVGAGDVFVLRQKVEASLAQKNQLLSKVYNRAGIKVDEVVAVSDLGLCTRNS